MKQFFLVFILSGFIYPLLAQDTASVKIKNDSIQPGIALRNDHRPAKTYLLYNYTSQAINSAFNQQYRGDAVNRITVDGNYYSGSIGVPAGLSYGVLFNLPISDALKDRADKHLGKELKFDENLSTGINYQRYFKKADLTLLVGYNYRQMLNITAPKQAFETGFYGNARFEGDTASLSNIHFDFYNYNQYSVGILKRIDYGKYQMEVGVTGSFLQVINNLNIETGNTTIYTAPYGEYVDLNYNLTFNQATTAAPSFFALNGIGASGDVHIAFANKDKWRVSLDIKDLGIMTFRTHEQNYSGANNVHFQGIVIPNLLNFSSQTFDTLNLDSALLSKLPSKSNNSYSPFFTLYS